MNLAVGVRNAMLDAIETAIGPSPLLRIRTGAVPALLSSPDLGDVLASLDLPEDWLEPATGGVKAKAGTWEQLAAQGTGFAGHFRIYDAGGRAQLQGTVTRTGDGGDMQLNEIQIHAGQIVEVSVFTLTAGNA